MERYGVGEIQRLLRLPRSAIRSMVDAGFVTPMRGPRNAWLFSFQDLVLLRTAQTLAEARIPRRRIARAVRALRSRLPSSMPLTGLRIDAVGDQVVVLEGQRRWRAESGQYLLAFDGSPANGTLTVVLGKRLPAPQRPARSAGQWFDEAMALEKIDPEQAKQAYARAIALEPDFTDAHLNLGCLLHETGDLQEAERAYAAGLEACGRQPELLFNLGVLLEDLGRAVEARDAYEEVLRGDARHADCHYNLALLCEGSGDGKEAIRHMAQYRRLTATR